jgi:transcription initiation factor TFIID subunit 1, fungi type
MKEFLSYDRDRKTWALPEGQTLLDENGIRAMIKPEDVCLIEAMQVGQQLLSDAGYDSKNAKDHAEDDDDGIEQPLVARMAPWRITKNFLDASAGKAMVALHGEGDPTGHGLGFSFIKTSMKGGYINAVQGPLATSADAMERERKANGGHSYNVKKQQEMYNAAIRQIWERQKASLSDNTTHDDADVLDTGNEDDRFNQRQSAATPAAPIDDGRSQLSRLSGASRLGRKKLKVSRKKLNDQGEMITESVVLDDPNVIRNYLRHRREAEEQNRE